MSGKLQTRIKHPLHMDRIIRRRADPKKLFTPKEIRTLDLMQLPQIPKPYLSRPGLNLKPTIHNPHRISHSHPFTT
jgi:hypothetical protein